jgi:hypothetical protein
MSWTSLYEIAPLRTLLKKYVDFRRRPITFPCSKETGLHSPFLLINKWTESTNDLSVPAPVVSQPFLYKCG